ncbi:MAG TPA: FAD-dependent oxidoreductase, partial [Kineosporiaceae bacterium]|nr:FAD-dependent oxidoreductase [Kineosporiaceae bacterium]
MGPALPARADVVVVGGGVMGTSTAFHLAEAGVDVLLVERDGLGVGSTSKAAGGVRAQFSDALNIVLGARGLEAFADFPRRPGQEIDLRRHGYLFLLT